MTSIALCGAGMISHAHVAAARHLGMDIVAIASRSEKRRIQRASELATRSVAYEALPAGADIVIVATPPTAHFDHVVHSLERGAAVIVEKPMVATLHEADRLVTIAERYGNRLLYAENLAYAPSFRAWISLIADMGPADGGDPLQHLSASMQQGPPTWGEFLTPEWGGGVLFDLGVHPIALMVLTARAARCGEVVAVSAHLDGDATDEIAEVALRFASGFTAHVRVNWRGPSTPHWSVQAASPSEAVTWELMPEMNLERNGDPQTLTTPATEPPMLDSLGYVDQLRAFSADLVTRSTPWMDASFGRWILEVVCACYVSGRNQGQEVPVPSGCDRTLTPWELWRR